jgi:hypothetical protein
MTYYAWVRRVLESSLIAVCCMAACEGQILTNGSFESGYTGWTPIGNQNVAAAGPYYTATSGTKLVAFNSGNSTPNGVLSQTFTTVAEQTYTLAFAAGGASIRSSGQRR